MTNLAATIDAPRTDHEALVALDRAHLVHPVASWRQHVQLIRVWSGIEGYTGDAVPVLGPSATTAGLHYAFGFNGEGFAIGPGVGEVMAELIATGATTTPIEPFSIARFAQKVALPA